MLLADATARASQDSRVFIPHAPLEQANEGDLREV
jgi:hypothetical protein